MAPFFLFCVAKVRLFFDCAIDFDKKIIGKPLFFLEGGIKYVFSGQKVGICCICKKLKNK